MLYNVRLKLYEPICESKFCADSKTTHKTFFPTGLNSSNKLTVGFIMYIGSSVKIQELGCHDFLQAKKITVLGEIMVRHVGFNLNIN